MIYHIDYDKDRRKVACPVKNRQELLALRDSEKNLRILREYRSGKTDVKGDLLQLAYNIGHVNGLIAGCKSIGSHFFHDIDCYDKEQSEAYKQLILSKKEEIGLLMMERSPSGGWHLVCRRERGKTILENQVRVATILQIEMDTNPKDLQRVVFSTSGSGDDLPFIDDAIFEEPMTLEESVAEYELLKERERRNLEEVPAGAKKASKHYKPWEETNTDLTDRTDKKNPSNPSHPCSEEKAEKASEASLAAFDLCAEQAGLKVDAMDVWGVHNWHANLMAVLSVGVGKLMSRQQLQAVVAVRLPNYSQTEDCQKLINYFYDKYDTDKGFMNASLREINAKAQKNAENAQLSTINSQLSEAPVMPKKLPKLIDLLTSKTPEMYKPAVAHAVFPALATHLCEVRFEYTDHVEHEATLMNCLMAETGAGKGCIDQPIEHIMADIKRRDKENERREAEWKKDCQKKGANKDKMVRPEGLVIQMIDPDMTKPALVTRMDEAENHFVYVKLNELDLFEQLRGQTGKQHFQLMCLAFDPGAEYGQTRVGTQSVTARPQCRFNWNACTTVLKGRRFFSRVLTDGPISRINFCTIPEQEIGGEQPIYGKYDAAFDEALKPYIDNLTGARGLVDCQQAWRLVKKLQEECAEFARLSQNATYWNLSHRACVIAWLKACVLDVANGKKWEKSIEDFIRWSLNYDLWCKMEFFGEDIEKANRGEERIGQRGPRNLLEMLPDVFTLEDAKRVRRQAGMDTRRTSDMIYNWKSRQYIHQLSAISFQKLKYTSPRAGRSS